MAQKKREPVVLPTLTLVVRSTEPPAGMAGVEMSATTGSLVVSLVEELLMRTLVIVAPAVLPPGLATVIARLTTPLAPIEAGVTVKPCVTRSDKLPANEGKAI